MRQRGGGRPDVKSPKRHKTKTRCRRAVSKWLAGAVTHSLVALQEAVVELDHFSALSSAVLFEGVGYRNIAAWTLNCELATTPSRVSPTERLWKQDKTSSGIEQIISLMAPTRKGRRWTGLKVPFTFVPSRENNISRLFDNINKIEQLTGKLATNKKNVQLGESAGTVLPPCWGISGTDSIQVRSWDTLFVYIYVRVIQRTAAAARNTGLWLVIGRRYGMGLVGFGWVTDSV